MAGAPDHKPANRKVFHILEGRLVSYKTSAATEPPIEMLGLWAHNNPERSRVVLADADIRADMEIGDPGLRVLRKCCYCIENARQALKSGEWQEQLVLWVIEDIRDYGAPQGVALLKKAHDLFRESQKVRDAVFDAVARIGVDSDLLFLLADIKLDAASPEPRLDALIQFAERFPQCAGKIKDALAPFAEDGRYRDAIEKLEASRASDPKP